MSLYRISGDPEPVDLEQLGAERVEVDYKAAKQAYDDAPVPIRAEDFVRRIVDAAIQEDS